MRRYPRLGGNRVSSDTVKGNARAVNLKSIAVNDRRRASYWLRPDDTLSPSLVLLAKSIVEAGGPITSARREKYEGSSAHTVSLPETTLGKLNPAPLYE